MRADVNVPLPGRETLFIIGPFTLFLKSRRLTAFVRAEASKDQKEVALSDRTLLLTNSEAMGPVRSWSLCRMSHQLLHPRLA